MKRVVSGLAGLVLLVASSSATAAYVTFTSRTEFQAATYDLQTIGFEGLTAPGDLLDPGPSLTLQGVTFTGVIPGGNYLFVVDPGVFPPLYDWGSGAILAGPPNFGDGSQIDIALPTGTTAFGTDLMSILPDGAPFQVTLGDGQSFTADTNTFASRAFFGVISDAPIGSVTFVAADSAFPLLDNFTIGLAAPVPPSLILFGMGALALATSRKLSRKRPLRQ